MKLIYILSLPLLVIGSTLSSMNQQLFPEITLPDQPQQKQRRILEAKERSFDTGDFGPTSLFQKVGGERSITIKSYLDKDWVNDVSRITIQEKNGKIMIDFTPFEKRLRGSVLPKLINLSNKHDVPLPWNKATTIFVAGVGLGACLTGLFAVAQYMSR